MLEKLIQAVFITFLLQIIAVLSVNNPVRYKIVSDISQVPLSLVSSAVSDRK